MFLGSGFHGSAFFAPILIALIIGSVHEAEADILNAENLIFIFSLSSLSSTPLSSPSKSVFSRIGSP